MRRAAVLAAATLLLAAGCGGSSKTSTAADAAGIAARLKAAGLPIGTVTVYTAATDPNHLLGRPGGYTSKVAFVDTRTSATGAKDSTPGSIDLGGSVEVFADSADAKARFDYGQKVEKAMPMLTEYDYLSGPVLLRVSKVLTPDQAAAYKKALG